MATMVNAFRTPGTVLPCNTAIGMVVLSCARAVSTGQRGQYRSARSATRERSASRRVVTSVIGRVRNPGLPRWSRTARRTQASGRAAKVSRASHEGLVYGFNQVTRWSWTPSVVRQRDRGPPVTAGGRRTPGLTQGRPGVKSMIGRAHTRSTAGMPAGTRSAR